MRVHVLLEHYGSDPADIVGVYATEELADLEIRRRQHSASDYELSRVTYSVKVYDVVTNARQIP